MDNTTEVFLQRSDSEQIRVSRREYRGKKYIDIRLWYDSGNAYLPTRKGIVFPEELLPEFKSMLNEIK